MKPGRKKEKEAIIMSFYIEKENAQKLRTLANEHEHSLSGIMNILIARSYDPTDRLPALRELQRTRNELELDEKKLQERKYQIEQRLQLIGNVTLIRASESERQRRFEKEKENAIQILIKHMTAPELRREQDPDRIAKLQSELLNHQVLPDELLKEANRRLGRND